VHIRLGGLVWEGKKLQGTCVCNRIYLPLTSRAGFLGKKRGNQTVLGEAGFFTAE
jgi:hypothetical protein